MKRRAIDINELKGRGRSLYIAVNNSGYTNKEAVKRAKYEEATFYGHVKQEFLDFKIMARYGRAIKHDFSIEYPDILDFMPENAIELAQKESKAYLELYRKYTTLLEKLNEVQEKHSEKYAELKNKYDELLAKFNASKK